MGPDVTLRGRLLDQAGVPLAGRRIGVCSADPVNTVPSLQGRVESDMELTVLLEPGEYAPIVRPPLLRDQPMRGVHPSEVP